jgi:serine/threonine protein kinase
MNRKIRKLAPNESLEATYSLGKVLQSSERTGEVRLCVHKFTKERFVLKTILKSATSPSTKLLYLNLLNLPSHPNLMNIIDIYENHHSYYIVAEYLAGGDLFTFLQKSRGFYENDYKLLFSGIFAGLAHLHKHGLIHGDIKPENLMWRYPSTSIPQHPGIIPPGIGLKIIDLDTCILAGLSNTMIGTHGYMAPEVWFPKSYSNRSDLFAVGVTMYFMVTHRMPYSHEIFRRQESVPTTCPQSRSQRIAHDMFETKLDFSGKIWGSLPTCKDVVEQLLQPDPRKRPGSAEEVLLSDWLSSDHLKEDAPRKKHKSAS